MTAPTTAERDALFRQVLRASMERVGAKKGALYVLEPRAGRHFLRCQEGFGEEDYVRFKMKADDPMVVRLAAADGPLLVSSPDEEPELADYMSEASVTTMLLAPVRARGVMIGFVDYRQPADGGFGVDAANAADSAAAHMASVALTIPMVEQMVPKVAECDPGPDDPTRNLGIKQRSDEGAPAAQPIDEGSLSSAVMKTLESHSVAAEPESDPVGAEASAGEAGPSIGSRARDERRRRPLSLPLDLVRDVMPMLFRVLPIDYAAVGLCEEGILVTYYVGPAQPGDGLSQAMVAATRDAIRKAPSFGGRGIGDLEFVQDEIVVLEPSAAALAGPVSSVHPLAVALPRMSSEAPITLVLAAIQVDRLGFPADATELLAQFAAMLKNLFLQRLRTLDYRQGYLSLLNQILKPIEKTLPYIKSHSLAVANYSKQMALGLNLDEMHVENIIVAAILHDVGLLDVDYEILREKGTLSEKDLHEIRKHPIFSRDYVEQVAFPYPVGPLVYSHHERWDGKGYPEGLRGEAIPVGARIIAVAEAFDAMTSRHSYKPAVPPAAALEELKRVAGSQFDPRIVDVFLRLMRRGKRSS